MTFSYTLLKLGTKQKRLRSLLTLRAQAVKNHFMFANPALPNRGLPGLHRDIEPLDVFHATALIANEMVVAQKIRVVAGSFAFARDFPHQAGSGQIAQTVVHGGTRNPRVTFVQRVKNLVRRGMDWPPD